ncbi:MAG: hypothetical protein ACFFDG_05340 [Promethearchaeota archaeon]
MTTHRAKFNRRGRCNFTVSVTVVDRDGDFDIETKIDYIVVN